MNNYVLVFTGPLQAAGIIRGTLSSVGIASWDSSDSVVLSPGYWGYGGQQEGYVYVERDKVEQALLAIRAITKEHPEVFKEPPSFV